MSNECLKEKNRDALHDYHEYTIPIYYQSLTMSECTIKNIKKRTGMRYMKKTLNTLINKYTLSKPDRIFSAQNACV